MQDVSGKVAFVTGGSSGIGLGIAHAFFEAGMRVVIGYRTRKHLQQALSFVEGAGNRVHPVEVDVADRASMERAAAEAVQIFGRVHVLVNNAGVVHPAPLSDTTYDDWDWLMNVNVTGVFNGIRAFLPGIVAHGEGGHVIATASVMGLFAAGRGQGAYTVSKFAVVGLMEALRAELADTNIGTSVFCPGLVNSKLMDASRNRPSALAHTTFVRDEVSSVAEAAARSDPKFAMDPLEAGRLVLRGMRNGDLYILSHPEYEQLMRERSEALAAAIPTDLPATDIRLEMARSFRSIYADELDRRQGGRIEQY
jgi:NAD(P)-dependent dehydrogenase (short-subunit alcohol dehydrogenase family)